MIYFYILQWVSCIVQGLCVTFSIGAGLFYLAELIEEYANSAKKYINYLILVDTILAFGLLLFEDVPLTIVGFCLICNLLYFLTLRTFPVVDLVSPVFIVAIVLFALHNYLAFDHFSSNYYSFAEVLSYMTLFCWLIPIILLISCSANDNVLPTYGNVPTQTSTTNEDLMSNYFKGKSRKLGLLSFMRYFQETYLPETGRKRY